MPVRPKTFGELSLSAIQYLANNTPITYLETGSLAKALVDATLLELLKIQDYVQYNYENSFLSRANGPFLDLFGEVLGIPRITDTVASISKEDKAVRLYVTKGTLGSKLPHPTDSTKGLVPRNITISNADTSVVFKTSEEIEFPVNAKTVYISIVATEPGASFNVGPNQLTVHSLTDQTIKVTNDIAITSGKDLESDDAYRFRLSKAFTARFNSNASAITVAALSVPGVSSVNLLPFSRGAGTFDVLVIPQGNKLTASVKNAVQAALDDTAAFGISGKVREPEYVKFNIAVKLRFAPGTEEGVKDTIRESAQSAILRYMASVPMGGEIIINALEAAILNGSPDIVDVRILEICLNGKPYLIRNIQLDEDQLLTPSDEEEAVVVL